MRQMISEAEKYQKFPVRSPLLMSSSPLDAFSPGFKKRRLGVLFSLEIVANRISPPCVVRRFPPPCEPLVPFSPVPPSGWATPLRSLDRAPLCGGLFSFNVSHLSSPPASSFSLDQLSAFFATS